MEPNLRPNQPLQPVPITSVVEKSRFPQVTDSHPDQSYQTSSNYSQPNTSPVADTINPGRTFGILSIVLGLIGIGLVGLILGIIGFKKSRSAGMGNVLAIIGIILSILNILEVLLLIVLLAIPALQRAHGG